MENKIFTERIIAIEEKCAKIGATFTHNFHDEDHLDCFWYDGNSVVEVSYKGHAVCFDVCGDVCVALYDGDNFKKVLKHKSGSRPFYEDDECCEEIVNDMVLAEKTESGDLMFDNNNWINIVVIKEHDNTWDEVSEPEVAGESNLLEAIENNFDYYISLIDGLTQT